jgi:hypothetical protein
MPSRKDYQGRVLHETEKSHLVCARVGPPTRAFFRHSMHSTKLCCSARLQGVTPNTNERRAMAPFIT